MLTDDLELPHTLIVPLRPVLPVIGDLDVEPYILNPLHLARGSNLSLCEPNRP